MNMKKVREFFLGSDKSKPIDWDNILFKSNPEWDNEFKKKEVKI